MSQYVTHVALTAGSLFNERFEKIEKVVPFNPAWGNGDYYNEAIDYLGKGSEIAVNLAPGEEAKSISPEPNNRKMIFMGTPLGTAVFFERYSGGQNGTIVKNLPLKLIHLAIISSSNIQYEELYNILGYAPNGNLGSRLHRAFPPK